MFNVTDAKTLFSAVIEAVRKSDNLDLIEQIINLKEEYLTIRLENSELREELRELRDRLAKKEEMMYRNKAYWLPQKDGAEDGPFCTKCHDADSKTVRMHPGESATFGHYFHCPACNENHYY